MATKEREEGMLKRYQMAFKKAQARAEANPKDEKSVKNAALYAQAIDNILKHGDPNGPKAPPHPGDVNISM